MSLSLSLPLSPCLSLGLSSASSSYPVPLSERFTGQVMTAANKDIRILFLQADNDVRSQSKATAGQELLSLPPCFYG